MKRDSFKFSFIAFSIAAILSIFSLIPLNYFRIHAITPRFILMSPDYLFPLFYLYYFYLGLIIVSLSLVSFLIGIIYSLLVIRSRTLWWKNRERKKNIVSSLILISIAFGLTLIAYVKLIRLTFFIQKWQFLNDLLYGIDTNEFNINYIHGIILIITSIVISIFAILLFSLRWKKNIFKIPSIIFSCAFVLSFVAVFYLTIFEKKVSDHYFFSSIGKYHYLVINSSTLSNYILGFILMVVSLILFIIATCLCLWNIISRDIKSKNYIIRKFLQNKGGKKTAIFSFILICTTIILILMTCLMFTMFDSYIMRNTINKWLYYKSGYVIYRIGFYDYYNRGLILFIISIIISLNAIFLFLSKFFPKNSEERVINSEEKPD